MEGYVRFTVEVHDDEFPESNRRLVWEKPDTDITSEDMCECIRTLMYGLTFSNKTINDMFVNYVLEHGLLDEVDLCKKDFDESYNDDDKRNHIWDGNYVIDSTQ